MKESKLIDLGYGVAKLETQTKGLFILTIMTPGSVDENYPYDPPQSIQISNSPSRPFLRELAETILKHLDEKEGETP